MKIVTDTTKIIGADQFGEVLREHFFVKKKDDDYGCYSTFTLTDNFKRLDLTADRFIDLANFYFVGAIEQGGKDSIVIAEDKDNHDIFVMWYWNGDGMLVVSDGNRVALSSDCKKDNRWIWANFF